MARILIFIFALTILIAPVSAAGVCEIMEAPSSSEKMSSSSMAEMDCTQCCNDNACSVVQCNVNSPTLTIATLFSDSHSIIIVAGNNQPWAGLAYYYKIVLPITTPPPLV